MLTDDHDVVRYQENLRVPGISVLCISSVNLKLFQNKKYLEVILTKAVSDIYGKNFVKRYWRKLWVEIQTQLVLGIRICLVLIIPRAVCGSSKAQSTLQNFAEIYGLNIFAKIPKAHRRWGTRGFLDFRSKVLIHIGHVWGQPGTYRTQVSKQSWGQTQGFVPVGKHSEIHLQPQLLFCVWF